jgi:hypothetical protein
MPFHDFPQFYDVFDLAIVRKLPWLFLSGLRSNEQAPNAPVFSHLPVVCLWASIPSNSARSRGVLPSLSGSGKADWGEGVIVFRHALIEKRRADNRFAPWLHIEYNSRATSIRHLLCVWYAVLLVANRQTGCREAHTEFWFVDTSAFRHVCNVARWEIE